MSTLSDVQKYIDTVNMKRCDPVQSQQHLRNIIAIAGGADVETFMPRPVVAANGPGWRQDGNMSKVSTPAKKKAKAKKDEEEDIPEPVEEASAVEIPTLEDVAEA